MLRGGFVSALGIVTAVEALRLRPFRGPKPVGDDTFPLIIAGALMLLGLILIFRKAPVDPRVVWPKKSQLRTMILTLLSLAAYCGLLSFLGYILSTFALAVVLFRLIGRYPWYLCLIMAGVTAVSLWQIFVVWLHMPFPNPIWVE
jgi:putative tricarboxylic transport membrane protein